MAMKEYDPRDVSVIVDEHVATGLGDGTFVQVEKSEENYETYVGAQGEITRARNVNPLGQITVTLQNTSPTNAVFNKLAKSKDTFEAFVIDRNNDTIKAGGSNCWFEKPADREWGDETSEIEWTIIVGDYDITEG